MQLHALVRGLVDLERDAHTELLDVLAPRGVVVALRDHHVAAVAAAALQVAAGGGVLLDGSDHLEELVPDRDHAILEPEHLHPGVHVSHLETEDGAQVVRDGTDVTRDQGDLSQPEPHGYSHCAGCSTSSATTRRHSSAVPQASERSLPRKVKK